MGSCGPMESLSRRRFHAQIPEPEAALPGSRHLSQRRLPIRCFGRFPIHDREMRIGRSSSLLRIVRVEQHDHRSGQRTPAENRHAHFSKV